MSLDKYTICTIRITIAIKIILFRNKKYLEIPNDNVLYRIIILQETLTMGATAITILLPINIGSVEVVQKGGGRAEECATADQTLYN